MGMPKTRGCPKRCDSGVSMGSLGGWPHSRPQSPSFLGHVVRKLVGYKLSRVALGTRMGWPVLSFPQLHARLVTVSLWASVFFSFYYLLSLNDHYYSCTYDFHVAMNHCVSTPNFMSCLELFHGLFRRNMRDLDGEGWNFIIARRRTFTVLVSGNRREGSRR